MNRISLLGRLIIVALGCGLLASGGQAQEPQFEVPPVLEAASFLGPEVLRGEHHVVREAVANDGYMNTYTIDSDFGQFTAYGGPLLAIRLREIAALAELDKLSHTKVFADAVTRSATSQVTALVDFAQRPVETVKGVPGGVKRMFGRTKKTVKEGAAAASEMVTDSKDGVESEEDKGALQEGAEAGAKYAEKYFGVSGAERRWAEKLGVDPYTRNEVLRSAIRKVAKVDAAGGLAVRFAPIPRIPGVSAIRTATKLVWGTDPRELREINRKALLAMGVEAALAEQFLDNAWYSPSAQTLFVSVLSGLSTVGGRPAVVELAALAQSYEEALFFLQAIKMLVGFKASGVEITQLLGGARLPGVLTSDGRFVFLVPVDRILWTEGIAAAATGSFEEVAKGLETTSREVWFRGQASKRCRAEIKRRGWLVRSEVSFSALAQTES